MIKPNIKVNFLVKLCIAILHIFDDGTFHWDVLFCPHRICLHKEIRVFVSLSRNIQPSEYRHGYYRELTLFDQIAIHIP